MCRTRTFKTWKNAHAALLAHDLLVTFADGETYKGRLDCKADGSDTDPAQHIRDAVAFMAGNRCPAHWDAEKYHAHIKDMFQTPAALAA